ncbi:hypothetical protein [Streptococcus oricebi]|uniref:Glucosyltransferase-I n=1 Tax=Streptococcus oricebi TaxID=1547447 RepID=A0ABS5B2S8_9STRE|nr:hypothetical protein [Streptococcus oricebi]MBP2623146.1 hypothetical protein [Streptococcus oricebi]
MDKKDLLRFLPSKKAGYFLAASLLASLATSNPLLADQIQQGEAITEQSQSASQEDPVANTQASQEETENSVGLEAGQTERDKRRNEQAQDGEQEAESKVTDTAESQNAPQEQESEELKAQEKTEEDSEKLDKALAREASDQAPKANGFYQGADGNWYYYKDKQEPVTGWQTIEGKKMYFRVDGSQVKGDFIYDNGKKYYFDQDTGELWTNRFIYKPGSNDHYKSFTNWYYLGTDGTPLTGYQTIDGKKYYFNSSGEQLKGTILGEDGKLISADQQTGEVIETKGLPKANSFYQDANGKWYYYNDKQERVTGWQTIDGKKMYFRKDGSQVKGDFIYDNGKNYYFDQDNGQMWTNRFVQSPHFDSYYKYYYKYWYYLGGDGATATGYQTIDGKEYYFYRSGMQAKGHVVRTEIGDNYNYYDDESGELVRNQFRRIYDFTFWLEHIPFYAGRRDLGVYMYFDANGKSVSGWQTIDGKKMYFHIFPDSSIKAPVQVRGKLIVIEGKSYYFDPTSGELWTNRSLSYEGKNYQIDKDGVASLV